MSIFRQQANTLQQTTVRVRLCLTILDFCPTILVGLMRSEARELLNPVSCMTMHSKYNHRYFCRQSHITRNSINRCHSRPSPMETRDKIYTHRYHGRPTDVLALTHTKRLSASDADTFKSVTMHTLQKRACTPA